MSFYFVLGTPLCEIRWDSYSSPSWCLSSCSNCCRRGSRVPVRLDNMLRLPGEKELETWGSSSPCPLARTPSISQRIERKCWGRQDGGWWTTSLEIVTWDTGLPLRLPDWAPKFRVNDLIKWDFSPLNHHQTGSIGFDVCLWQWGFLWKVQ